MFSEEAAIVIGAAVMSAVGAGFAYLAATTARRLAHWLELLAGSVLLLVAATHLAPEALHSGQGALMFLVAGVVVGLALEVLFRSRPRAETPQALRMAALVALAVLGVHSTLDGAVYTATFYHNGESGLLASLGLIIHEAPEGMVAMLLCLELGLGPRKALLGALAVSSLTTPLGWLGAHLVGGEGGGAMDVLFAASAGLLIFVGGHLVVGGVVAMRKPKRS